MSYDEYRNGLLSAMSSAAEELARLDAVPNVAEMPNGTVLFVRREFEGGSRYDYVYLKAADRWYATGRVGRAELSTDELRRVLSEKTVREISVVTDWAVLYGEPAQTEGDDYEDEDE